ncbi:MAG: molybdopterin-dependent oxidoreductase, partial [Phycisphaerales bacterium]|nr:molybdopterin-dependent oxidoreductase [Phycisphaerales bacterium]
MSKSDTPLPVIELATYPPVETWDDVVDLDPAAWPKRVERHSMLVPTTCFNCEAGCGLMAWVDPETQTIRKLEGNPHHPGSRGRNCAKGPATINQIEDPERILYPLKRVGARGSGEFARVSWDEVLDDLAGRMRTALLEDRHDEIMYHVGRPGADGYMDRVLKSWGVDAHNSHTNV